MMYYFTVKRPQPGPPEDFQPIRNRNCLIFSLVTFDPKLSTVKIAYS